MFNNLLAISDDKDIQEEILCIQKLQERERPCPCCGEVRSRPIACTRSSPLYMASLELFWSFFRCGQISYCGEDCLVKDSARHRTFCGISLKDMF